MAEGVLKHLVHADGRAGGVDGEPGGLGGWHVGEAPDERAQAVARKHGVAVSGSAQQFRATDFARFDLVLALDTEIYRGLERLTHDPAARAKIRYLRDYDPQASHSRDVPDPYYGTMRHFEQVYDLVERSCRGLLTELNAADGEDTGRMG